MWVVATIIGYRTIRVWFRDDIGSEFKPGMYILKGETTVLKQWKHGMDIKCKRLVVPTSYFSYVDIESWIYDFDFGYPVPFEILSLPILVTNCGQWIHPSVNPCVYDLTQNTTQRNKLNFQNRTDMEWNTSNRNHVYYPSHDFGSKLETMFTVYANMLPYCDEQLRKMILFWPIDLSLKTLVCNIYCDHDDCFEFIPCSAHT